MDNMGMYCLWNLCNIILEFSKMCQHFKVERLKKNNGIQNTLDSQRQLILGNCLECGTTITIGIIKNGKEKINANYSLDR